MMDKTVSCIPVITQANGCELYQLYLQINHDLQAE